MDFTLRVNLKLQACFAKTWGLEQPQKDFKTTPLGSESSPEKASTFHTIPLCRETITLFSKGNSSGFSTLKIRHHCYRGRGVTGEKGDVMCEGRLRPQRKAAAQCKAKEISINHSPNRFPTCVRCLPRNTESHKQLPCSGKAPRPWCSDRKSHSREVWMSTAPLMEKLLLGNGIFCTTSNVGAHHSWTNPCFAHGWSNGAVINLIRRLLTISSFNL